MTWTRLPHAVVEISGKDAVTFLQTKLTADTRKWKARGGGYATAVDINGKIVADLWCYLEDDTVTAVVESDAVEALVATPRSVHHHGGRRDHPPRRPRAGRGH